MVISAEAENGFRSYAGQLLLAMPDMPDRSFHHSAIALCVHDGEGAMGIDLGSVVEGLGLRGLMASFDIDASGIPDAPVMRGGPVEPQRGFILHSLDWRNEHMMPIGDRWGISGSLEILKDIARGRGPSRYVAALGYAGWGAGQLDGELARPGWFVGAMDEDILFATEPEDRWARGFAFNGVDPHHIIAQSGHA
ncbi:YqgE/AlgH family protein [Sphingobium sufflavum]|uniref:YqgE/AlgH family protein n=1 Tax=Sphingobium sufflavum TaxID=1129547 RepID=UPI001F1BE75D|nr:YqgE/AlgH family protein [Sphingobium sufflavum]MCE7797052.1 YqgE/AlgH family protein [Sphingobium sufflavum]